MISLLLGRPILLLICQMRGKSAWEADFAPEVTHREIRNVPQRAV